MRHCVAGLAVVLLLAFAAPAPARTAIDLPRTPLAGPVLAGDLVVWADYTGDVEVLAAPVGGGPTRVLRRFRNRDTAQDGVQLAGGPGMLAIAYSEFEPGGRRTRDDPAPTRLVRGEVVAGAPDALKRRWSCPKLSVGGPLATTGAIAWNGPPGCKPSASTTFTVTRVGAGLPRRRTFRLGREVGYDARLAGDRLALRYAPTPFNAPTIRVFDWPSGTQVGEQRRPAWLPPISPFDVQADGKLAFAYNEPDRQQVAWSVPGEEARPIPPAYERTTSVPGPSDLHLAGDRLVYKRGTGCPPGDWGDGELVVTGLDGGPRLIAPVRRTMAADFDGRVVAWFDGFRTISVQDLDAEPPPEAGAVPRCDYRDGSGPQPGTPSLVLRGTTTVTDAGTLPVRVACTLSFLYERELCALTVTLRSERAYEIDGTRRRVSFGSADAALEADERPGRREVVQVQLPDEARELLEREGTVPVRIRLDRAGDGALSAFRGFAAGRTLVTPGSG